jgi:hypothetical protein
VACPSACCRRVWVAVSLHRETPDSFLARRPYLADHRRFWLGERRGDRG